MVTRSKLNFVRATKARAIDSGLSHVLYGHTRRPKILQVSCPRCGGLASALKVSEKALAGQFIGDTRGTWGKADWAVECTKCSYRGEDNSYESLPNLFFKKDEIWAWNRDHLLFMIDFFSGISTRNNPYHGFNVYLPQSWLKKKSRTLKIMQRMVET